MFGHGYLLDRSNKFDQDDSFSHIVVDEEIKSV